MRIIFHVDVNNAFLSWTAVKLLSNGFNKDIRLFPSVIGGDESKRHGIVLAKSPIAKKYDIKTAETLYTARKKCSNLEVYPPDFAEYIRQSQNLYNYLSQYTPDIEQFSIDECYLDLTNTNYLYDDILSLAYKMKNDIKKLYGFTVNIGIGNSKLCAKMASDFEKPDKVHTLFNYEISTKMWPLPIEDLLYIGKSSATILNRIGLKTIGDLANIDINYLKKYFKNRSMDLINSAKGIDESKVENKRDKNKCISISSTLEQDTSNIKLLHKILLKMCEEVAFRARKDKLYARVIAITIRTSSFRDFSHQKKLVNQTNNTMDIYNKVLELFKEIELDENIRNIGVRLSDLTESKEEQINLFDINNNKKNDDQIQELIDNINNKYHGIKIMPASFYEDIDK